MRVMLEDYTNEYERGIESLRKWTDAFVALLVSCNLVVLVALISNMIYNLGSILMLVVEAVAIIAREMALDPAEAADMLSGVRFVSRAENRSMVASDSLRSVMRKANDLWLAAGFIQRSHDVEQLIDARFVQ